MRLESTCVYLIFSGLFFAGCCGGASVKVARLDRWVKAGFQYLKMNLCRRVLSLTEGECKRLSLLQLSGVTVYVSEPNSEKVRAVLPDSHSAGMLPLSQGVGYGISTVYEGSRRHQDLFPGSSAHDAVLVLDPSPEENFGHPVILYYVDQNVTKKRCGHMDGIYLGEECLTLALKSRCQNQLKRRQSVVVGNDRDRRASVLAMAYRSGPGRMERSGGLCEVHFLPLVVGVGDYNRTQRLRCVDQGDFGPCPRPLPQTGPALPVSSCELNKNTRRCHQQPLATHLSCRLYQTCDHAMLLSGGWQELITYQRHVQNLQQFYRMLRNNGFHREHIKTFFAGSGQLPGDFGGVYPATEKAVIRNHISYICRKQHCVDSLVLYLNSPTRNDGTMLLWDGNHNGLAELKERYSVGELLADLTGCRAGRVLLFVEQSYSGVLAKRLRNSVKHPNVALLHAHAPYWPSLHPAHCLLDYLGTGSGTSRLLESSAGLLNVTLAGAPCNATPPLTEAEMRKEYQGCQNLPTALWYHNQNHNQNQNRRTNN